MKNLSIRFVKGRLRRVQIIAVIFALISVTLNIFFIVSNFKWYDSWASTRKAEGMLRIMRYIELERELDDQVRDEFVDGIWKCLSNDYFMSLLMESDAHSENQAPLESSDDHVTGDGYIPEEEKRKLFLESKPIVNPHNHAYLYDHAEVCTTGNIDVIIASPSSSTNFNRRHKMRSGHVGQFAQNFQNRAKLLFFIGQPTDFGNQSAEEIQRRLNAEQTQYQDIVQSTFLDTYKNITKKGLLIPKWISTFCPNAQIVLRIDDDVDADAAEMVSAVKEYHRTYQHFILGVLMDSNHPFRKKTSKYFTSFEDYPYKILPPFLLGGSMGYPIKTARILFEACRRTEPVFWLDDVWVTAMCAKRVAVPIFNSPAFSFWHGGERVEKE